MSVETNREVEIRTMAYKTIKKLDKLMDKDLDKLSEFSEQSYYFDCISQAIDEIGGEENYADEI